MSPTGERRAGRATAGRGAAGLPARGRLFGLAVHSDLPLPLTAESEATEGEAAVAVVPGPVAEAGHLVWREPAPFAFACYRDGAATVLAWPEARFRVTTERVVVDTADRAAAADLLVPAVWSVVLALRGQEALHGCAAERDGRAVAVLGASGAGKSTAAQALLDRGWRLVTDDLLALDAAGDAVPGPPFVRLPPDRASGRPGQPDTGGKRRVAALACPAPVPLAALVVLGEGYGAPARLSGWAAAAALLAQFYCPLPLHLAQPRRRFELALDLAARVPVYGAAPRSLTARCLERLVEAAR